jgi:hypothetical protein
LTTPLVKDHLNDDDDDGDDNDEEEEEEDDMYERRCTDDVHEMCLSRCNFCGRILALDRIFVHLNEAHAAFQFTREVKYHLVRKTYYRWVKLCTLSQGCGSGSGSVFGSGLDPDSIGSVDPDPDSESGSGSRRAKVTHKSRNFLKVHVLKCWMASFEI